MTMSNVSQTTPCKKKINDYKPALETIYMSPTHLPCYLGQRLIFVIRATQCSRFNPLPFSPFMYYDVILLFVFIHIIHALCTRSYELKKNHASQIDKTTNNSNDHIYTISWTLCLFCLKHPAIAPIQKESFLITMTQC